MPICNCFLARRANGGKLTILGGYLCLMPSFEENSLTQFYEILSQKLESLWLPTVKFYDHSLHRLDRAAGYDEQTDRQTNPMH